MSIVAASGGAAAAGPALALPRLAAQPGVRAKELAGVVLLRPRHPYVRLDRAPFIAASGCAVPFAVIAAASGAWGGRLAANLAVAAVAAGALLAFLLTHWNLRFRVWAKHAATTDLARATAALVVPAKYAGTAEIVPLAVRSAGSPTGGPPTAEVGFEFRKQVFVLDAAAGVFEKLPYPVHETFEHYGRASGYGSDAKVLAAAERWGLNQFVVPLPPFSGLMKEQMLAPFFVFQVFCVGLWCLDEYWRVPRRPAGRAATCLRRLAASVPPPPLPVPHSPSPPPEP